MPSGNFWPKLQFGPLKSWSRVGFTTRGNVFMTGEILNLVVLCNRPTQAVKAFILRRSEPVLLGSFQLNTDGVIVAVVATPVAGLACMPRAFVTTDKLQNYPGSPDEEVARYLHAPYGLEIRVSIPVQSVGEKLLYLGAAIYARR